MWLRWIHKRGVLPPPINVLYVFLPVCWVVKHLASAYFPRLVKVSEQINNSNAKVMTFLRKRLGFYSQSQLGRDYKELFRKYSKNDFLANSGPGSPRPGDLH